MNKFLGSLKFTYLYNLIFPVFQIIRTADWFLKGKCADTPHLIKQSILKTYKEKYDPQILIETGTYLGSMVNALKGNFSKIYTIELDKKLSLLAKNKFKKFKHIKVIWGDSSLILPKLLKNIDKPCLFWLDAHFSKGITVKGNIETPVMEELTSILSHPIKKHVILIDDADSFNGKRDFPTLNYLKSFIEDKRSDLKMRIEFNVIRITPK